MALARGFAIARHRLALVKFDMVLNEQFLK